MRFTRYNSLQPNDVVTPLDTRQSAVLVEHIFSVNDKSGKRSHDGKQEDDYPSSEVVTLDLTPHVEHLGRMLTSIMNHGTTRNNRTIRIHNGVKMRSPSNG